ncbi:MAG: ECF transporter S component [Lachnospiraceae bacterium]|nr:ECF transporter S component [Lachnospiraceae bacterium]
MTRSVKMLCVLGAGIALFVVLSLCLQVPVFENYYLCLGYAVMLVYCYSLGPWPGVLVGALGVVLYCLLTSGLRGMPGWSLGNVVIGLGLGFGLQPIRKIENRALKAGAAVVLIIVVTAAGILGVKSLTEHILYAQPFMVRAAKNFTAFVADAVMLAVSIPIAELLDKRVRKLVE